MSSIMSADQQQLMDEQFQLYTFHTTGAYVLHSFYILFNLGGVISNIVLFSCIVHSKSIRSSNSGILTAVTALLDAFRACIVATASIYFLQTGLVGGGVDGCYLSAVLTIPMCGISLYCMVIVAIDRYMAIVHCYQMSKPIVIASFIAGAALSFFITFLPAMFHHESYYGIKSAGLSCIMHSSDRSQAGIIVTTCTFLYLLMPSMVIFNCYLSILKTVIVASVRRQSITSNGAKPIEKMTLRDVYNFIRTDNQSHNETSVQHPSTETQSKTETSVKSAPNRRQNKQEYVIFRKSLILFIVYNLCWSPFLTYLVYETASGQLAPSWFDAFSSFCNVSFMYINAILNIALDERYKRQFSLLFFNLMKR